jgi:hypothetical protein
MWRTALGADRRQNMSQYSLPFAADGHGSITGVNGGVLMFSRQP